MSLELLKAAALATDYHCFHPLTPENAFRKSKTGVHAPYVVHVFDVLKLLIKWGITDLATLIAGVCHDMPEDTTMTYEELVRLIGKETADVVMELTFKPSDGADSKQKSAEKANKMESYRTSTIRAYVIKIADRLNNVMDFFEAGGSDAKYAIKYFHKADALWEAFEIRKQEIIEFYGVDVFENIRNSINDVHVIVGGNIAERI